MDTRSKAGMIKALLDTTQLSTSEIATKIGVLPEYVRVVKQRRDPNSWIAKARREGDADRARSAARRAYNRARGAGQSSSQAQGKYSTAYMATLARTRLDFEPAAHNSLK